MLSVPRRYVWKGTVANPKYEHIVEDVISKNHKLAKVDTVEVSVSSPLRQYAIFANIG